MSDFETVIGLEIHAELSTKTKMFCSCKNDPESLPNANVCPICMGFPGQLPVLNKEALNKGIIAALALNCEIQKFSKFDRKNYFYPDLPKGFQISQYDEPVSKNGFVDINTENGIKRIKIRRLHLEDDAGKLTHTEGGSLCDYNRSGVPLMEIVSDPDMSNSAEAVAYAKELQTIIRFSGSSSADMEKGMMRFDASVSVRPVGDKNLYFRAEIKNLNSYKALQTAIDYEAKRQIELVKAGTPMEGNFTVGWDDEKQQTYMMRGKEGDADYRYFPEPDLPPIIMTDGMIDEYKKQVPEMPAVKRKKYADMGVAVVESEIISSDPELSVYFEKVIALTKEEPKKVASFICSVFMKHLNEHKTTIGSSKVTCENLAKLFDLVIAGSISGNMAKGEIFDEMFFDGKDPEKIIEEKGLKQVSDSGLIEEVCKKVVEANPGVVAEYKSGKDKLFGFFVGQAMKELKGQGNPVVINDVLKRLLA